MRSAAHTVVKPSSSAVCAACMSPSRLDARPETGRNTPKSICAVRQLDGTSASTRAGDPVPSTSFSGATTTTAPFGGSSRQVRQLRQPVAVVAEQVLVHGEDRVEAARRARVDPDGLHAEAGDAALGAQPPRRLDVRPGGHRALGAGVEEGLGVLRARVPAGAEQHPRAAGWISPCSASNASRSATVRRYPGSSAHSADWSMTTAGPTSRLGAHRGDVLAVLAADPVDRRVEVRARVLADLQDVPGPGRARRRRSG